MKIFFATGLLLININGIAQTIDWKHPQLTGMYLQWGYNRDKFSKSDLHFHGDGSNDFIIHDAEARDKPDFSGFRDKPFDITIPQNSFRIGFYLNQSRSWAIELNFDHAKYVVKDSQRLHIEGTIQGEPINKDTTIYPYFMHLEHTNGANFYHINYVRQVNIWNNPKRTIASVLYKAGAGIMIPKSDVTLFGKRLDNKYHIAGYIASVELGARIYPIKNLFLEANIKGGFANYKNALGIDELNISHKFWYGEVIGLLGYQYPLNRKRFAGKQHVLLSQ